MSKDMENGEVREYEGKKYKYVEIEAMESDIDFIDKACEGCDLKKCCIEEFQNRNKILGNCFERYREDGRNGIFVEVEEG